MFIFVEIDILNVNDKQWRCPRDEFFDKDIC